MRGDMREVRDAARYRPGPRRSGMYRDGGGPAPQSQAVRRPRPRSPWLVEPTPPPHWASARAPSWSTYALRLGVVTAFAVLVPFVVAGLGLARGIDDEMAAVGFDAARIQLIEYALVALVGSVVTGIVLRWRAPVWLGGLLYYVFGYLLPYIGQAQRPTLAPDGTPQVLAPGAFAGTVATLLAVGVVFSGAGAVLGEACGRVFAAPLITLGRLTLARVGLLRSPRLTRRAALGALAALALSAVILAALALVAANLDTILNYGTVATIYQPVRVATLQGTLEREAYRSPVLGGIERQCMVYLPPSYAAAPQRRYPVVYMLHGNPGAMTNWFAGAHMDTTANVLIAADKVREAIFVAPDGNGPVYRVSEWANSLDKRQRMEDSVAYDLVRYVDAHFRTLADPAHRAIAGISEGGFAAANIALHHPNIFGTALSLSGFFQADGNRVFGVGAASNAYLRYNSPALYVATPSGLQAARSLTFIICVGTQDGKYYSAGVAFYRELRQLGSHADLLQGPGGHSWQLWALQAAQALPIMEPPAATAKGSTLRSASR
jgi:enterochelin esterase-like enzyme